MKNKGEGKREHEREDEHDEEAETKVEDEDDSLNMKSCTKMMSDPFLASGGSPRSLLAPQGGPLDSGEASGVAFGLRNGSFLSPNPVSRGSNRLRKVFQPPRLC